MLQVQWTLTSAVDGRSADAARRLRDVVERIKHKVGQRCDGLPDELRLLDQRVRAITSAPVGAAEVARLDAAFSQWAEAIGARFSPLRRMAADLVGCRRLNDEVTAGYAVWWDYSGDGRRWWVVLTIDNAMDKRLWVDLAGSMRVRGLTWPRSEWPRGENDARRITWGGSSYDNMYAWPASTSSRRVGATEFVTTTLDGSVYAVRPEVLIFHEGHSCSLPVPRLN